MEVCIGTYLNTPTGHDWAWHSKAKLELVERIKMLPFESVEKLGGLEPIGSVNFYDCNFKTLYI